MEEFPIENITQEYLKSILDYNEETGIFKWKERNSVGFNTRLVGTSPGNKRKDGYLQFMVKGKSYLSHRLAYLWVTGILPKEIDHINCIKDDNRFSNLRECSRSENCQNVRTIRNITGMKGVGKVSGSNTYQARLTVFGKRLYLGSYNTVEEAGEVVDEARKKYHNQFYNKGEQV